MTSAVDNLIIRYIGKLFPAAQIEIRLHNTIVYSRAFGFLDPDTQIYPTSLETRFDVASVTKLFTTAAFIRFVANKRVSLDQPVCHILPEFSGPRPIISNVADLDPSKLSLSVSNESNSLDAKRVTFRELLAHNSGLPKGLHLWMLSSQDEMKAMALNTPFAYHSGTQVLYCDIGYILLGFALERIAHNRLEKIIYEQVIKPLNLVSVEYGPLSCENVAPTEFDTGKGKRICGEVHDENARGLGGIAGNAGLFATAKDIARFGQVFLNHGESILSRDIVNEMTRIQAEDGVVRRGLGFELWSPDPQKSSYPLSQESFGHYGFTGASLWMDPARELVVACFTNRVYYGRSNLEEMRMFRRELHRVICTAIDS